MTDQINLIEINNLVQNFLLAREQGIKNIHRFHFKNDDQVSLSAFQTEMLDELRTGCVSFINSNYPMEELDNYLFYIANAFCQKIANNSLPSPQRTEYICPACSFLKKEPCVLSYNKIFVCGECQYELSKTDDPIRQYLFKTFASHSKNGYRCHDCRRFIPHPIDQNNKIICPYFDCSFVGLVADLKKMHHPTLKSNVIKITLDSSLDHDLKLKDNLSINAHSQLEIIEGLQNNIDLINGIIETQSNNIPYNSSNMTIKHKQCVYQAFSNLLKNFPVEMTGYLLNTSDNYSGFQHKIFQEYIKLLESFLPYSIMKNGKIYKIENLLDDSLSLFDGISVFTAKINNKLSIKNGTKEFYIGGRKAVYAKPYYIGKLLNVVRNDTKSCVMSLVKEYSFTKIQMRDIEPNTEVIVTHLRTPPHYQMGGMVYVNRIRKKIAEKARSLSLKSS